LKTNFKQIKEKVISCILSVPSITVILIVFSIYRRCWGFTRKPIDVLLAVNGSNPVSRLEPSQIKDVLIKKLSELGVEESLSFCLETGDN
jgi:phosphate transport system permease protein